MDLKTILTPDRTLFHASGSSKKRVLENIAQFIAETLPTLDANTLFRNLIERERLGSTGLGNGIAIPHCRLRNCNQAIGSLVTLAEPVNFESVDDQPVDLLFVLLVPEKEHEKHLAILAGLAERFSQSGFCQGLRNAGDSDSLYHSAISYQP